MNDPYMARMPLSFRTGPHVRRESTWHEHGDVIMHADRIGDPGARRRVIFLHGAGGHSGLLWPFSAAVARRGLYVVAPDLPGYGRTEVGDRSAVRYTDWVSVADEFVRAERDAHDGPLIVAGASMGGLLGYDVATRTGAVDALVATCLLDPRDPAARRRISRHAWLGDAAPRLMRVVAGPLAGVSVPMRWLANMAAISNDPQLTRVVLRDRLGGGTSMPLGFLRSFLEWEPAVEPERAGGFGVVLAHPAEDRWTPVEISLPFFERHAGPRKLVLLEGAGHFPVEEPGAGQLVEAIVDTPLP
ncbi:alpha/beta hydrolase [Nocardiopsis tropica]|uniref:Alpha/beta hydrolase n=1 Tax=Nocardiopsis tropica TaxID=109330 RepID=A0ABU7KLG2_9ACTN|nr:alpha/beta hydrolase [Nocardiopsis umidischolae]MEE2050124.1 alpha/beta hydrolase [Nocardiopsis umidischolae]